MARRNENLYDPNLVNNGQTKGGQQSLTGLSQTLTGPLQGPSIQTTEETFQPATPTTPTSTGDSGGQSGAPTYAGTYEDQLAQLYDQITNRDPFSYDVNMDPMYQNYKDQYIQGGKLAMRDTMGQAAALTGGYGSTYSQAAGQQAYDAYLQQLTDKIPELYDMAYGMYKDKGDQMMQQYSMLGDLQNREYSQWRDAMGDYNYEREFAAQQEQQEWARQQQEYANLVSMIQATGYKPTDKELQAAGMTRRQAEKLRKAWQKAQKGAGGGKGGGGGSRRNSGPANDNKDKPDASSASQDAHSSRDYEAYQAWLAEELRRQRQQQQQQQRGQTTK